MARDDVADRVTTLTADALCVAVVASPPCSTWCAARFKPGAPQLLRTREHPIGVRQSDCGLPATVTRADAIVANCVANAAHMRGGNFVLESPVSRGADSRFAIEDKSEHVDMSNHDDLARLAATAGVGRIFFAQCVFGASAPKATHQGEHTFSGNSFGY
eukprot:6175955-Pleurochrysis_carterae.AAC.6